MLHLFKKKSTRSRYIIGATVAGILIIFGAILAQIYVAETSTHSADNIRIRTNVVQLGNNIRSSYSMAEDTLTLHLLSPSNQLIEKLNAHLSDAIANIEQLLEDQWIKENKLTDSISIFKKDLLEYKNEATKLMQLRMVSFDQYPGFKLSQENLFPQAISFFSQADLVLDEISELDHSEVKTTLYAELMAIRHSWSRMILLFRLYMLNRMGTLDEEGLKSQEANIEIFYTHIIDSIGTLKIYNSKNKGDIVITNSLDAMISATKLWLLHFEEIIRINHANAWRTDILLIKQNIQPLDHLISEHLAQLENNVVDSAAVDVGSLSGMASTIINSMWIFTAAGLILIVIGFLYFEFTILRPVAMVAKALKAEARGERHHELPAIKTVEAENLIAAFSDMRNQVYNRQKALEYQALHDALTGLPNRTLLHDRLEQGINASIRKKTTLALLFLDLDHFKEINDTLGHHIGDEVLVQLGARILGLLRDSDTVARLGGDEFAVLLPTSDKGAAIFIAQKIQKKISEVFNVQEHKLHIGASIGVVIFPEHGGNADLLMQHADVAMYIAKRDKAGIFVYNPEFDTHTVGRLSLVTDLRDAIADDTLELYYQPKLRLNSGKAYGAEALLRWNHPVRGFIPPDEIIAAAEFSGVIKSLTKWVINKALKQNGQWNNSGMKLSISINLSVHDLQDKSLVKHIDQKISEYDVNPRNIVFEITESAMMSDPESALNTLSELDDREIWLSIDDYGTGFSSLAYIKRLPVDELKIDKSFVLNMHKDENDAVIVRSTIDLAHNLGLKVVAEGIEDKDTWDLLALLGCDSAQGFYMSKPLPPHEFKKWHAENIQD